MKDNRKRNAEIVRWVSYLLEKLDIENGEFLQLQVKYHMGDDGGVKTELSPGSLYSDQIIE